MPNWHKMAHRELHLNHCHSMVQDKKSKLDDECLNRFVYLWGIATLVDGVSEKFSHCGMTTNLRFLTGTSLWWLHEHTSARWSSMLKSGTGGDLWRLNNTSKRLLLSGCHSCINSRIKVLQPCSEMYPQFSEFPVWVFLVMKLSGRSTSECKHSFDALSQILLAPLSRVTQIELLK